MLSISSLVYNTDITIYGIDISYNSVYGIIINQYNKYKGKYANILIK